MKRILIFSLIVNASFAMQKEPELLYNLKEFNKTLENLEDVLKRSTKQSAIVLFDQLAAFSNELNYFLKNPTDTILEELANFLLKKVVFENIEQLSIENLKKLRKAMADLLAKIEYSDQHLKRFKVRASIQNDFHEMILNLFKQQKEVVDQYITCQINQFQKTLFDQSLHNVRIRLEAVQKGPSITNIGLLANSLQFNIRFLDALDSLSMLAKTFINFNQLAKDIETTFNKPNKTLQELAKKTGHADLIKKYTQQMYTSLQATREALRVYLKKRLAEAQQKR